MPSGTGRSLTVSPQAGHSSQVKSFEAGTEGSHSVASSSWKLPGEDFRRHSDAVSPRSTEGGTVSADLIDCSRIRGYPNLQSGLAVAVLSVSFIRQEPREDAAAVRRRSGSLGVGWAELSDGVVNSQPEPNRASKRSMVQNSRHIGPDLKLCELAVCSEGGSRLIRIVAGVAVRQARL